MSAPLDTRLDALAIRGSLADGTPCRTLGVADVQRLSAKLDLPGRTVEIAALKRKIIPDRYLRNQKSLSMNDQIRLLESSVCIVGLGGLGGLVTDTLARTGIGRFILVDGDRFEAHNLNRQLLSDCEHLGLPKVAAAVNRVKMINPGIEVTATETFLQPDNAATILDGSDLVVDCLDNIPSRFTLQKAAKHVEIPMISAAIAGLSGHLTTIFPRDKGLVNIYGPEDQVTATGGVELELGCLAPGVNLVASLACTETLKVLLKRDQSLSGRLLVVDLSDYTFETLKLG